MKKAVILFLTTFAIINCTIVVGQIYIDFGSEENLYTYQGSTVVGLGDPDWDYSKAERKSIKEGLMEYYNGLTYHSQATTTYNCHLYAWFKTENYPGVNYWLTIQ